MAWEALRDDAALVVALMTACDLFLNPKKDQVTAAKDCLRFMGGLGVTKGDLANISATSLNLLRYTFWGRSGFFSSHICKFKWTLTTCYFHRWTNYANLFNHVDPFYPKAQC